MNLFRRVNAEGDRVLDAGAGTSPYRHCLLGDVWGIDIQLSEKTDVVATAEQLPFADSSFSGITCFQVLYYVPRVEAAIAEFHRILKPGGWVALSVSRSWAVERERRKSASARHRDSSPPSVWDARFRKCGFILETPLSFTIPWRWVGTYYFALLRKQA